MKIGGQVVAMSLCDPSLAMLRPFLHIEFGGASIRIIGSRFGQFLLIVMFRGVN